MAEPTRPPTSSSSGGCFWPLLFFAAVIFWVANQAIPDSWLDQAGLVSHSYDSMITAQADWLNGETKACVSVPVDVLAPPTSEHEAGYVFGDVFCDSGPKHSVKIKFYGRKDQPEYKAVLWQCKKENNSFLDEEAFVCKQTGASGPSPYLSQP